MLTYKLLFAFDIFQIKSGSRTGKAGRQPREDRLLAVHVRSLHVSKEIIISQRSCTHWDYLMLANAA